MVTGKKPRCGAWRAVLPLLAALSLLTACSVPSSPSVATDRADGLPPALQAFIEREVQEKGIPALSIALVDGDRVVWAEGFGQADPTQALAADADTVYRVGSVSKLFTDIAAMQLVEKGELDLDAPVSAVLPDFRPANPFGGEITLRQLMAHRAGLVRESPVGSYFDAGEPGLAATVDSLNGTTLVHAPDTRTKYSNAGIAVVGRMIEQHTGRPFEDYMRDALLAPMGMRDSGFAPPTSPRLAKAQMWTLEGRSFDAPVFALGTGPAGNLQSSANDLARFLRMLLAEGRAEGGQILGADSLRAMWTPAPGRSCPPDCYGIGFRLGELDGQRMVGHGGAVYGFSTQLSVLPDQKLGVVVMATKDAVNPVLGRIAEAALRAALAQRAGTAWTAPAATTAVPADVVRRIAGRYRAEDGATLELAETVGGGLSLLPYTGGSPWQLRMEGEQLRADGALVQGPAIQREGDALILEGVRYARLPDVKPAPPPEAWRGLIGEYGWDYNTLFVLERDGQLWALVEWFEFDPLQPVGNDEFAFSDNSMYAGERIRFQRDARGRATGALMGGIAFARRQVGPEDGAAQLYIEPVRPAAELLEEAKRATPPQEQGDFLPLDLVEVARLDSGIRQDVRYAGTNNFLQTPFYSQAKVFLQRPAAEALARAQQKLAAQGYGLLLHDGYRPWFVTKVFWEATPDEKKEFVANPAEGSRHNRGAAIDLNLYELDSGRPAEMVATYDETTPRSSADYPGGTSLQRWQRRLLRDALESEGYEVLPNEWWHFDYQDWQRYPIGNVSFEDLSVAQP